MKKGLCTLALLFITSMAFSQNPVAKGQMQLNAGAGFSSNGIPLYVGLDYGVHKDVTVGGEASFRLNNGNSGIGILGNGNYHFNSLLKIPTKYDFYAGANVGFHLWLGDYDGADGLSLGFQVGGRYYFNEKFGLNLEFGGGNFTSGGKIGISLKL